MWDAPVVLVYARETGLDCSRGCKESFEVVKVVGLNGHFFGVDDVGGVVLTGVAQGYIRLLSYRY